MINEKKRLKIFIPLIVLAIFTSGCISLSTKKKAPVVYNGGIFKTVNKGETWQHTVLIPTISGQPGSIGALNTSSLAIDPDDSKAVYFGSSGNGLFYSYDGAQTWQRADELGNVSINAVAIDPESRCVIYAAIANQVYKTTDCNRSWLGAYHDDNLSVAINAIAVDHYDSKQIYIGSSRGEIIKSYDRGVSWQTIRRFANNIEKIVINPHDSRNIFVATSNKGIYRSRDGGASWADLGENLEEFLGKTTFRDIVAADAEPGLLFLATHYGLIRSEDGGDTWSNIKLITPEAGAVINAIAVNPKDAQEIYYVTNTTFYRSLDGGKNWSTKKLPTSRVGRNLIIDSENPNIIYIGVGVNK